jgi:hypothetical protein
MIIPSFALSILLVPFFLASGANAQFACDPPTIVSPSNGDFGDATFNITGYVNYPCGDGLIRIMSDLAGRLRSSLQTSSKAVSLTKPSASLLVNSTITSYTIRIPKRSPAAMS